jgi:hypothetical protein
LAGTGGQLYRAIASEEETDARHWLARLAAGAALIDLCEHVIASALSRIGDDRAAGRVWMAQKHRASAICEPLIAPARRAATRTAARRWSSSRPPPTAVPQTQLRPRSPRRTPGRWCRPGAGGDSLQDLTRLARAGRQPGFLSASTMSRR